MLGVVDFTVRIVVQVFGLVWVRRVVGRTVDNDDVAASANRAIRDVARSCWQVIEVAAFATGSVSYRVVGRYPRVSDPVGNVALSEKFLAANTPAVLRDDQRVRVKLGH